MTNPSLWNQLLIWPILNLLVGMYNVFRSLGLPGALGLAIITLTLLIRLILYPLMAAQLRSAKKLAKLKPHMDELTTKHKNDKQALQRAQLALYQEHGINPAAGCLPLLIQFPVLIALYNVFFNVLGASEMQTIVENINTIAYHPSLHIETLDLTFFGTNLASKPSAWQTEGIWLLSVPIITGLLQWVQSKMMMTTQPPMKPQSKKGEKPVQDTAAEIQKQMMLITPVMFGFFAYQFPLGLALYWNVFGVFGIIQQYLIQREVDA